MPLDDKTVFTDSKDFTLSALREMYSEGDLITNPDYQREYVYDSKKASKLIESILMGIPIPAVYLCEEANGNHSVIDGQQRITSFVKFLDNEFALTSLTEIPEYNGKLFKELEKSVQKKLKASTIRAVVILKESQDLKYEIFARLNQGAVSLKPQELRNCIYRGSFNTLLDELANNPYLPKMFHDVNNRKSYQERILRFFALLNYTEYKSSFSKTMNNYMSVHQNDDEKKISEQKAVFTGTIDIVKQILGDTAFFGLDRRTNTLSEKFSGSVYDSIMIPFSRFEKGELIRHADEIRNAILDVKLNNTRYLDDTYAATGSTARVRNRINMIYNLIWNIIVSSNDGDNKRLFSDEIKKQLYHPGYICSYCHNEILSIDDAEVDHAVPYSLGGKTEIENAQLLHRHCNREKYNSIDVPNFEDGEE